MSLKSILQTIASSVRHVTPHVFDSERMKGIVASAPEQEFKQTKVRVYIVAAILVYLLWYVFHDGKVEQWELEVLAVTSSFLAFSVALVVLVLATRRESVPRRLIGMVFDNAVATYFISQMGEAGAVILFVY